VANSADQAAANFAAAMKGAALAGPTAYTKQLPLSLDVVDAASDLTFDRAGPSGGKPTKLTVFLKLMARVLPAVQALDEQTERLKDVPKTEAFVEMLRVSRRDVSSMYDLMREETARLKPDTDALKTLKSDLEAQLNSMRLDVSRVAKMFPDPNAPAKAKAKGKAKILPAIADA
jgi:hypothetical protein